MRSQHGWKKTVPWDEECSKTTSKNGGNSSPFTNVQLRSQLRSGWRSGLMLSCHVRSWANRNARRPPNNTVTQFPRCANSTVASSCWIDGSHILLHRWLRRVSRPGSGGCQTESTAAGAIHRQKPPDCLQTLDYTISCNTCEFQTGDKT